MATEVTKQERLLYGHGMAPVIRRIGQAAANVEEARALLDQLVSDSSEADSITSAQTSAHTVEGLSADDLSGENTYDEHGRSPSTIWLMDLEQEVRELELQAASVYRDMAIEAAGRNKRTREAVPSVSASPPAPVAERIGVE